MHQSARQILVRTINTPEVKQRPLKPNSPTGIVDKITPMLKQWQCRFCGSKKQFHATKNNSTLTTSREPFFFVECLVASQDSTFTMVVLVSIGQGAWKFPPNKIGGLVPKKNCWKPGDFFFFLKFRLFVFDEKTWKYNLADLWYSPLIYAETL